MFYFVRRPGSKNIVPLVRSFDDLKTRLDSGELLSTDEFWDSSHNKYDILENLMSKILISSRNTVQDSQSIDVDCFDGGFPGKYNKFSLIKLTSENAWGQDYLCENDLNLRYIVAKFSEKFNSKLAFLDFFEKRIFEIIQLTQFSSWCVRYIEVGTSDQSFFLVKELVEWSRLEDLFHESNVFGLDDVYSLFLAIAKALNQLHNLGFEHGMLCPSTILVKRNNGDWEIKLDSYGFMPDNASSTKDFLSCLQTGDTEYLAPELTTSFKHSKASDVFSFGKLLEKALSYGVLVNGNLTSLDSVKSLFPKIDKFLTKCLSVSRGTRLPDASAVLKEMEFLDLFTPIEEHEETESETDTIGSIILSEKKVASTSVCFSPDGKQIADAGRDGILQIWDVKSGNVRFTIQAHDDAIQSISFSPSGKTLASAGGDGTVKIWDLANGNQKLSFDFPGDYCYSLCFSSDGEQIAIGTDVPIISLYSVASGDCVSKFYGHKRAVRSLVFSSCGKYLVSGGDDHNVLVWNLLSKSIFRLLELHNASVVSVSFTPDGRDLVSRDEKGSFFYWNVETGQGFEWHVDGNRKIIQFSPKRDYVVEAGNSGSMNLLRTVNEESLCRLIGHTDKVISIGFSPTVPVIVTSSEDLSIRLWNLSSVFSSHLENTRKEKDSNLKHVVSKSANDSATNRTSDLPDLVTSTVPPVIVNGSKVSARDTQNKISYHSSVIEIGSPVLSIVTFPSIGFFAVGSADHQIRIYSINSTSKPVLVLGCHGDTAILAISECGGYLACATGENFFRIWNVRKPAETVENRLFKEFGGNMLNLLFGRSITLVAYSSRGQVATSGMAGDINVWSVSDGTRKLMNRQLLTFHYSVHSLCFSNDGSLLFAAGEDVCMLDVFTGQTLGRFARHGEWVRTVVQSPDSTTISTSGDDGVIRFWKAPSDRSQQNPKSKGRIVASKEGQIFALAYSSSGNILVSGGSDCLVKIWSPHIRSELAVNIGHSGPITSLALYDDDKYILSGSEDGTVRIWTKVNLD
jgi:WD40 repeat protein